MPVVDASPLTRNGGNRERRRAARIRTEIPSGDELVAENVQRVGIFLDTGRVRGSGEVQCSPPLSHLCAPGTASTRVPPGTLPTR